MIRAVLLLIVALAQVKPDTNAALRIVVIEGEGAVNIIQQKTAVAPVVEVRDRNNIPVPGAAVTFTLGGNSAAFAGGAQTLTVTTNAAGRALAAINPLTNGAVQVNVSAAFQGQTAIATITQTNVMTAAEAAATASGASGASSASGASGASSASGAAAGGAGGGLSATTIGVVAGAVGGGLVAAEKLDVFGGKTVYAGDISAQWEESQINSTPSGVVVVTCGYTLTFNGTMKMALEVDGDAVKGTFEIKGTTHSLGTTCPGAPLRPDSSESAEGPVSGTVGNITFQGSESETSPLTPPGGGAQQGTVTKNETTTFTGSLSGDVITGTLVHSERADGRLNDGGTFVTQATARAPITLRKQ